MQCVTYTHTDTEFKVILIMTSTHHHCDCLREFDWDREYETTTRISWDIHDKLKLLLPVADNQTIEVRIRS